MSPPYGPTITFANHTYWPEPYSLLKVPSSLHPGLGALGTLALISVTALTATLCFIVHRLIAWRSYYACFPAGTQCIILILNLLLADLQQSLALTISFHWLRSGSILAPSAACTLQGWLLHAGDVSSGFFVLGIALHTYLLTGHQTEISNRSIFWAIGVVWMFSYVLASLGVALHGKKFFVRAGPWCWVSEAYEEERLALHYLWIFLCQFGVILVYAALAIKLMRKVRQFAAGVRRGTFIDSGYGREITRVAALLVLYPVIYIALTLPLSAGRMWSMARQGQSYSSAYAVFAGCMITSCGFADVLVYLLTRLRLLRATGMATDQHHSLSSEGVATDSCTEPCTKVSA